MMSGYVRKVVFYALVILIPLTIFFSLAELMARLLAPVVIVPAPPPLNAIDPHKPNPYIFQARPYIYFHIPGSKYVQSRPNIRAEYEINAQGFRGPEIPFQKPDGKKRLIVIGDSVVEGYGVEFTEAFAYKLGENLKLFGWEVINAGVQGGSPTYYAANIERYLALNSDAVLIVLYENDIPGDRVREDEYFKLPYLDNPDSLLQPVNAASNILSISRFYTAIQKEWRKFNISPVEQIIIQNQKNLTVDLEQIQLLTASPDRIPSSFLDQQWDKSRLYLDFTVTTFQKHQVQVLLASLNLRTIQPDSPYYDLAHHLDDQMAGWAAEKQLLYFSLIPVITSSYKEKQWSELTIKEDGHPNPETHALIEAALRPWLLQHLQRN